MTEGHIVLALQACLLFVAWFWKGGNDRLIYWLAGSFVASLWFHLNLSGVDRHVALALVDTLIVAAATRAWISGGDLRGWWVGLIGLAKLGSRLFVVADPVPNFSSGNFWVFAATMNAAFALQVIIAGGLVDVVGNWIAAHLRHAGPRRARLLRNVEGR